MIAGLSLRKRSPLGSCWLFLLFFAPNYQPGPFSPPRKAQDPAMSNLQEHGDTGCYWLFFSLFSDSATY
jgi:hypothetical protein